MPYTTNQGVRIHYQVEGAGPPLVIQHGFTDSMATWYELGYVEALQHDYRLILVDARGHGHSDKPHDPDAYETALLAGDVVAVLDAVHVPQTHFMGYSMGGWIGFAMATYAPERLHSLIIGGAHPYPRVREAFQQRLQGLQQGAEAIAEMWDAPVSPTLRARLRANDVAACMALTQKWMDSPGLDEVLPTLRIPCLLYAGEADAGYPAIKTCSTQIPHVTFVSFPGLNHAETCFHKELVVPHVTRFLHAARESMQARA
jgi:pimeloyl-ACP methyl ester carboxylesterase